MTEKLTDEERELLGRKYAADTSAVYRKALRIIDAQAAALDRVRGILDTRWRVHQPSGTLQEVQEVAVKCLVDIDVSLAAAPEATETRSTCDCETARDHENGGCARAAANAQVAELQQALAATVTQRCSALARVAELEGLVKHCQTMTEAVRTNLTERLHAANARADAAEREAQNSREGRSAAIELMHRAESEAAQLKARLEEAERELQKQESERVDAIGAAANAESEAAALRAEGEDLRAQLQDADCDVNRLLDEAATWIESPQHAAAPGALMLARRIRERKPMAGDKAAAMGFAPQQAATDHEHAVLEACDGAAIEWVQAGTRTPRLSDGSSQTVAEAELARRAGAAR